MTQDVIHWYGKRRSLVTGITLCASRVVCLAVDEDSSEFSQDMRLLWSPERKGEDVDYFCRRKRSFVTEEGLIHTLFSFHYY